jgi:hypothetical protein
MVGTIIPMVYGERIGGGRDYTALALYVSATLAGGVLTGLVLGYVGQIVVQLFGHPWRPLMLVGVSFASFLSSGCELNVWRFPLPQSHWQVPRHWQIQVGRRVAVVAYGTILGSGVFTKISSASFYLVLIWPVLLGDPTAGAAGFIGFAIGRVTPVVAMALSATSAETAWRWVPLLDGCRPAMIALNAVAMAACGGLIFGIALATS